jgi:hypothetical protein
MLTALLLTAAAIKIKKAMLAIIRNIALQSIIRLIIRKKTKRFQEIVVKLKRL